MTNSRVRRRGIRYCGSFRRHLLPAFRCGDEGLPEPDPMGPGAETALQGRRNEDAGGPLPSSISWEDPYYCRQWRPGSWSRLACPP